MNYRNRVFAILVFGLLLGGVSPALAQRREVKVFEEDPTLNDLTGAQWVWAWDPGSGQPFDFLDIAENETAWFRYGFEIEDLGKVSAAYVSASADNYATVWVNEEEVLKADWWRQVFVSEVTEHLKEGKNQLLARARNGGGRGPAGFVGKLVLRFKDGREEFVSLSSEGWEASLDKESWRPAEELGGMGIAPWGLLMNARTLSGKDFTRFVVEGEEERMQAMRDLFWEYYLRCGPTGTIWDQWLPMSVMWPAQMAEMKRGQYRADYLRRAMSEEGYITTKQHRGMGHPMGWPFPVWLQTKGWGWHWSVEGNHYRRHFEKAMLRQNVEGWVLHGFEDFSINDHAGLVASLKPNAVMTTPDFEVDGLSVPYMRLEWQSKDLADAKPWLEYKTDRQPEFDESRRVYFDTPDADGKLTFTMIPMVDEVALGEKLTGVRIGMGNSEPAKVTFMAVMTAPDTRHNVNQAAYLQGCSEYLRHSGDISFLKENIAKMRKVLEFGITEFSLEKCGVVHTPWRGHSGRSGVVYEDGEKRVVFGEGVGDNYWDLMPFGGYDMLASTYYRHALGLMAEIEAAIARHPEWGIAAPARGAEELKALSERIAETAREKFWNEETGRFYAAIDFDGKGWDYGYTFVNLEAIYYGVASEEQARSILDWVTGERIVEDDTAQGEDIYHWRFAPRSSTRRNIDWYMCAWHGAHDIAWGDQVQDGGAVLGFSYHDLMARLMHNGPDDAWRRYAEIADWYMEVQAEGGVREYYSKPGRGNLQGGGTAGGLGIDREFAETIMVTQLPLYGFLGYRPRLDGMELHPRLPSDWPGLTVTGIDFQGGTYDIAASGDGKRIDISVRKMPPSGAVSVFLPAGNWRVEGEAPGVSREAMLAAGDGLNLRLAGENTTCGLLWLGGK